MCRENNESVAIKDPVENYRKVSKNKILTDELMKSFRLKSRKI
jgi:hypothetical protein